MRRIAVACMMVALILLTSCTSYEPGYMVITDTDKHTADVNGSGALATILEAHRKIHEGDGYYVKNFTSVGSGASIDFLFAVADNIVPHMQWQIASESEGEFFLYEDVEVSDNGTPVTTFNCNRNSSNEPSLKAYSSPTLAGGSLGDDSQGGTLISASIVGSNKETTANRITTYELIGRAGTTYWIRLTNTSASTSWIDYDFNWYEEEL